MMLVLLPQPVVRLDIAGRIKSWCVDVINLRHSTDKRLFITFSKRLPIVLSSCNLVDIC